MKEPTAQTSFDIVSSEDGPRFSSGDNETSLEKRIFERDPRARFDQEIFEKTRGDIQAEDRQEDREEIRTRR